MNLDLNINDLSCTNSFFFPFLLFNGLPIPLARPLKSTSPIPILNFTLYFHLLTITKNHRGTYVVMAQSGIHNLRHTTKYTNLSMAWTSSMACHCQNGHLLKVFSFMWMDKKLTLSSITSLSSHSSLVTIPYIVVSPLDIRTTTHAHTHKLTWT